MRGPRPTRRQDAADPPDEWREAKPGVARPKRRRGQDPRVGIGSVSGPPPTIGRASRTAGRSSSRASPGRRNEIAAADAVRTGLLRCEGIGEGTPGRSRLVLARSGLATRGRRSPAGILAAGSAGWSGGSSGSQPGMRWPTGGAGAGVAVGSSADGRVGAERPWILSGQVAACAGSAGAAMRPDRRWTTSTTRLWPATAPRRREVMCRNCLSSGEGRDFGVVMREKTRSASDMWLQTKRMWPGQMTAAPEPTADEQDAAANTETDRGLYRAVAVV